jgi:predicted transcriptional regulator
MKTIIGIEDFETVKKRSLERARKLDRRTPIKPERRVTFEREQDFNAFLKSSSRSVLVALMQQPRSLVELAQLLKRKQAAVSRDVNSLKELGLVRITKRAHATRGPELVVRAVAKRIDLHADLST